MTHTDRKPPKAPVSISQDWRLIFLFRLDLLERNLRPCNGADEVHAVGNMRNVVQGLKELLTYEDTTEECVREILERLEKQQLEFFKKKYGRL